MAFYGALFGWVAPSPMDMGPGGLYHLYKREGAERHLGGIYTKSKNMPTGDRPHAWLYYAHVDDIHAAAAAVTANGGTVLNGPMQIPSGDVIAQCVDPQGALFALHGSNPG